MFSEKNFLKKSFGETKVPCTLGKPILEVLLHVTSECIETCAKLYLQHVLEKRAHLKTIQSSNPSKQWAHS